MPNHSNLVMMYGDPKNYEPPMTIELARKQGFTDFTFYPTAREAAAAVTRLELHRSVGCKAISFDQQIKQGENKIVLHVMGEFPRPKPVIITIKAKPLRWTCGPVEILEYLAGERTDQGARILMHAAWYLENRILAEQIALTQGLAKTMGAGSGLKHNATLDAFAVFMGEWAAKIKNAVSR